MIATVPSLDARYPAFDAKPGQMLFVPPADRVRIWWRRADRSRRYNPESIRTFCRLHHPGTIGGVHMPKMKRISKPENAIVRRGDDAGQGPMIELE